MIRVESLTRRYGDQVAVDSISFAVEQGEMFGLIGPDGAGKTTTLRLLLGLLRPDAGRITTCGLEPFRQRAELSRRVGYLSQRFSLYGDLSVDENIAFFAEVHGVTRWGPRREELLDTLRMTPFRRRLAERLSGGMKQKLALACTLIHTPQLLILDEPTTGVDPVSRRDFWKILLGLQREGMTILLTTPYLDEAERCGRVGLMNRARLMDVDTPEALRARAPGTIVELIARPSRRAAERLLAGAGAAPGTEPSIVSVTDVQTFGERLHVTLSGLPPSRAPEAALRLTEDLRRAGIEVTDARPIAATLEDVFIARIRESNIGSDAQPEARFR